MPNIQIGLLVVFIFAASVVVCCAGMVAHLSYDR